MEIILLERIENLGQMGEVVRVKPGYARNYLLPQKKAVRLTDDNRKRFEAQRAQLEATNLERRGEAQAVGAKLDGLAIVLIRQAGEAGQLYGSVSARDISDAVTAAGFTVNRQQIRLQQPIKMLGLHKLGVSLHPEVIVQIIVNVARTPDEAETQARTGTAIARTGAERREEDEQALEEQMQAMFEAEAADTAAEELVEAGARVE
ncbi:MAG TPA: 50S ribosomal protein L9 [Rhodospirillales bacterium]|nr:50S ribosomal protein L9 [Rhodospirillales bacterium]